VTDLNTLNARLAALRLPPQTEASLAALPAGLDGARIEHALQQAERGQQGALVFLSNNLRNAPAPAPVATTAVTRAPGNPPEAATAPSRPILPAPPASNAPAAPRPAPANAPTPSAPASIPRSDPPAATPPVPSRQTPPAPAPSAPGIPGTTRPDRVGCHIYGGKAALCVESDETRQNAPTLRIEAARATAPQTYDWKQKIAIQLTADELPLVAATVLGLLPRCACKNHGPDNTKGLEIEHQGTHLLVRVFQKDQGVRAVPVGPADSYYLAALGLRQLRKAAPWLTDQGVLALLRLTAQRMVAASQQGARAA
jgi:hypothetical protein